MLSSVGADMELCCPSKTCLSTCGENYGWAGLQRPGGMHQKQPGVQQLLSHSHSQLLVNLPTALTRHSQVLEQLPVLLPALMDALNAPTARVAAEALSVLATIASHSHSKHFQPLMKQLLDRWRPAAALTTRAAPELTVFLQLMTLPAGQWLSAVLVQARCWL